MRTCLSCGIDEQRQKDANGRERVNLDPVSGLCVTCLVRKSLREVPLKAGQETALSARLRRLRDAAAAFDARQAQAGRDDD